jgi:hypothetical protein
MLMGAPRLYLLSARWFCYFEQLIVIGGYDADPGSQRDDWLCI